MESGGAEERERRGEVRQCCAGTRPAGWRSFVRGYDVWLYTVLTQGMTVPGASRGRSGEDQRPVSARPHCTRPLPITLRLPLPIILRILHRKPYAYRPLLPYAYRSLYSYALCVGKPTSSAAY
eukprot:2302097-Rhodomonas_salina.1